MRLYNTIVVFDVYAVAENEEDARNAVMANIRQMPPDGLKATEENALEVRELRSIRSTWLDQKPCVGEAVSDENFNKLRGKNTQEIFEMLHVRKEGKK